MTSLLLGSIFFLDLDFFEDFPLFLFPLLFCESAIILHFCRTEVFSLDTLEFLFFPLDFLR